MWRNKINSITVYVLAVTGLSMEKVVDVFGQAMTLSIQFAQLASLIAAIVLAIKQIKKQK